MAFAGEAAGTVAPAHRVAALGLEMEITPCAACNERRLHTAAEWAEFHDFSALKAAAGERAGERSAYSLAAAPAGNTNATPE